MKRNSRFYWEHGKTEEQIPEVCRTTCEKLWEAAINGAYDSIDMFHDCNSTNLAYEDMSLQGGPGQERYVGVLTRCETHAQDAFAEEYSFICKKNKS